MRVNGNLTGVRNSYIEVLDKLYDEDVKPDVLVNEEIINTMVDISDKLQKEISVFVSRRGKVVDVSVGDYSTVSLPSIDYRRGTRRLSGIRAIHTHPGSSGNLSSVDVSALINLRLDLIAGIGIKSGKINDVYMGYLEPVSGALTDSYKIYGPFSRDMALKINILDEIKSIEKGIDAFIPELTDENEREKVLIVGLSTPDGGGSSDDLLDELEELANTAGAEVVGKILQKRSKKDPASYIGSGKAHELSLLRQSYNIDSVVFDDELSGAQVRNLEDIIGAKVIDRTALILDIFASRAQTREGKLQVELAQLKYRMPRLIGLGKVLSRTGGGIGTRGPGEKKLEIDRRHISERIDELEKALEEVRKNRGIQREKRNVSSIPVVSLVGYTNSGKSTLRNTLSRLYQSNPSVKKEDVLEANMLFATLDPTTRLIRTPKSYEILVSDTVGFIRKLPHDLVDAFRATLEEVVYSNLLIHVIDSSAPNAREQMDAVNSVLDQLDAQEKPVIIVLNKIDKVPDKDSLTLLRKGLDDVVEISALYGDGIDSLLKLIEEKLFSNIKVIEFHIPFDRMSVKSSIYNNCRVLNEDYDENGAVITAEVDAANFDRFKDYARQE